MTAQERAAGISDALAAIKQINDDIVTAVAERSRDSAQIGIPAGKA